MNTPNKKWWYLSGDDRSGPHTDGELLQLARSGIVTPETLVWKDGLPDWTPASRLSKLWQRLAQEAQAAGTPTPPAVRPAPAAPSFGLPAESAARDAQVDPDLHASTGAASAGAPQAVDFQQAIKLGFQRYFVFSGRASRSEYWYFYLFLLLVALALAIVGAFAGLSAEAIDGVNTLFQLGTLIPTIAIGTRRLHDTGRSGWWQLLTLTIIGIVVLIYFWVQEGDTDANAYGPAD